MSSFYILFCILLLRVNFGIWHRYSVFCFVLQRFFAYMLYTLKKAAKDSLEPEVLRRSVSKTQLYFTLLFWALGLPRGSLLIALVCPSVVLSICPSGGPFFLIFCMTLGHHKGTKVTEPDFWKEILGDHKWGENPIFGTFLMFLSRSLHPVAKSFWNSKLNII